MLKTLIKRGAWRHYLLLLAFGAAASGLAVYAYVTSGRIGSTLSQLHMTTERAICELSGAHQIYKSALEGDTLASLYEARDHIRLADSLLLHICDDCYRENTGHLGRVDSNAVATLKQAGAAVTLLRGRVDSLTGSPQVVLACFYADIDPLIHQAEDAIHLFERNMDSRTQADARHLNFAWLMLAIITGMLLGAALWLVHRYELRRSRDLEALKFSKETLERDMERRIEAEQSLLKSEVLLRSTLDTTADGILVMDNKGQITDYNRRLLELWHIPAQLTDPGSVRQMAVYMESQTQNLHAALAHAAAYRGTQEHWSYLLNIKDGRLFEVLSSPQIVGEAVVGRVLSFRDVTRERRHIEIKNALIDIAAKDDHRCTLEDYLAFVHHRLSGFLSMRDFTVALYDASHDSYSIPYRRSEGIDDNLVAEMPAPDAGQTLIDLVRRTGKTMIIDETRHHELVAERAIAPGTVPVPCWLGAPLQGVEGVLGVIALRDNHDPNAYTEDNARLLEIIAGHVTVAVERRAFQAVLRESEERYRTLADSLPQVVFEINDSGRLTYMNRNAFRKFGYTKADFERGMHIHELLIPSERERVSQRLRLRMQGIDVPESEYEALCRDGRTFTCMIDSEVIHHEGQPIGLRGILIDISVPKQAEKDREEGLRRVRRQHDAVIGPATDDSGENTGFTERLHRITKVAADTLKVARVGVWLMDESETICECTDMYDRESDSNSGGYIAHLADYPVYFQALKTDRAIAANNAVYDPRTAELTEAYLRPNGISSLLDAPIRSGGRLRGVVCHEWKGHPRHWREDEIRFAGEIADQVAHALLAAERREAEETVRQQDQQFKILASLTPAGIFRATLDGQFVYMSERMLAMLGQTITEVQAGEWEQKIHPEDRDDAIALMRSAWNKGESFEVEFRYERSPQESFWVLLQAQPEFAEGRLVGYVGTVLDITDRKRAEQESMRREKLESVGVLAGGIAHDFNNLLTAVIGNISLARLDTGHSGDTHVILEEAEKAAARAQDLTLQLLTFSKGGTPVREAASIEEIIRESVGFVLRGSKVACRVEAGNELFAVVVDAGQISQVMQNLIINAHQAMPDGGTVRVRAENLIVEGGNRFPLAPGRYVKLTVADEGVGIPEEHLDHIFDPYFTTKKTGSGLGLATTYSIVRQHGGHIEVSSTVGEGTTFRIYLPATERRRVPRTEHDSVLLRGSGRVLIMDDERPIQELVSKILARYGYDVELTGEGREAIERFRKLQGDGKPVDLVILDLTVPGGLGGRETLKILRGINPELPAIVCSGYSTDPVMANYADYGFNARVGKPFRPADLVGAVNSLINQRQVTAPVPG